MNHKPTSPSDGAHKYEIIENESGRNPIISIPRDEVLRWFRAIADAAGFSDREICGAQLSVDEPIPAAATFYHDVPTLTIMVSNIPNSRALQAERGGG